MSTEKTDQVTAPAPGRLIGAVDAGSNAIRFSIYKLDSRLHPMRVHFKRYPVRFGAGTFATGSLAEADMAAAMEAFGDIAATAGQRKVIALPAVATSAIREASNCDDFLARVKSGTGIELRVITGSEEARLAAIGAVPSAASGTTLVTDVGGGSSEVILVQDGQVSWNVSIPVGAVRLANKWGSSDHASPAQSELRVDIVSTISTAMEGIWPYRKSIPGETIAVGGTADAIHQLAINAVTGIKGNQMTMEQITKAISLLQEIPQEQYSSQLSIPETRTAIILPGALILDSVLAYFETKQVTISDASVRDGLVQDYLKAAG